MRHLKNLLPLAGAAALALVLLGNGRGDFIDGAHARELVKGGALLLDVRTPGEFQAGHIEGALNIPVQELEAKLASLPAKKDQPVVVYCRSGARSATAKGMMERAGFTKVHNLGPMTAW